MYELTTLACAVCGAGEDRINGALLTMTIIISLLPLAMLGGLVGYFVWKTKKAEAEASQPAVPGQ